MTRGAAQRDALAMWVIYERPSDYPESFVVRRVQVVAGKLLFDKTRELRLTLEEARAAIPAGLHNLGRQPGDDPVIREVWL